jgi:GTPase KRas protein
LQCSIEVFDTTGGEDIFPSMNSWINAADGFLLVYSITDKDSFQHVHHYYRDIMRSKDDFDWEARNGTIPIMLVGNNCGHVTNRSVSTEDGTAFAKEYGCMFVETSAQNPVNVEKAFYDVVRTIRRYRRKQVGYFK